MPRAESSTGGGHRKSIVSSRPRAPIPGDGTHVNAQANAEYGASKKASKNERRASVKEANAQYKEEVSNARINRKADRDAANNSLKATELDRTTAPPHVSH